MNAEVMRSTPPTLTFISTISSSRSAAGVLEVPIVADARVVHQHVELREICLHPRSKGGDLRRIRNVALDRMELRMLPALHPGRVNAWRRPVTMTSFPSSANLRAKARPIPAEPPVMRIVRLVSFIEVPCCIELLPRRRRHRRNLCALRQWLHAPACRSFHKTDQTRGRSRPK